MYIYTDSWTNCQILKSGSGLPCQRSISACIANLLQLLVGFPKNVTVSPVCCDGLRQLVGRLVFFPRKCLFYWDRSFKMPWRRVENRRCSTLLFDLSSLLPRISLDAPYMAPRFHLIGSSDLEDFSWESPLWVLGIWGNKEDPKRTQRGSKEEK